MQNIGRPTTENISFIFIDLQEKLLQAIPNASKLVNKNSFLLKAAKAFQVPLLATTQYIKGLGELVPEFAKNLPVPALDKLAFSCGMDNAISQNLKSFQREWVVVSGVETHICVLQTVLDLIQSDYRLAVVVDAVGARHELDHQVGLRRMERAGALLVTVEMLVYELLRRSDSLAFKELLPSIKRLDS